MSHDERMTELLELCEALCRGELADGQQARLQELVKSDAHLRTAYVRYLHMHVCLRRAFEGGGTKVSAGPQRSTPTPASPETPTPRPVFRLRFLAMRVLTAASILLMVGLAFGVYWLARPAGDFGEVAKQGPTEKKTESRTVATLTNSVGCSWGLAEKPAKGSRLRAGRIEVSAGVAEITFDDGTVVLIEAPAVLELVGPSRAFLHSGRVVARVPHPVTGFVIDTMQASVLDLGTEFGVGVGYAGDTLVQVFEGAVVADFKTTNGSVAQQRLAAGQTVHMGVEDGHPRELTSSAQRFVRKMPPAKERGAAELVPYNRHRFDAMHIVPAVTPPTIDGDLADWDLSGSFFCPCEEPFGKDYNVRGAMMYDKDFVYIGAHVADPAPMCSVIDPVTDPTLGWKAGGVQVRLSSDKALGWPTDAVNGLGARGKKERMRNETDLKIAHLTMWYCAPKKLPCLHIAYGMDFKKDVTNPDGFRGAFHKDKDGRGYTLEYAIPWRLLNVAEDPPHAGDTLGCTWNVHWSDEEGRLWRGYLVDVLNPDEKDFTYFSARTWGKAIYHATGKLPAGTVKSR